MGGLPVSELNALELEFLRLNNYNLFVTIEELQKYGNNILQHWNQSFVSESMSTVKEIPNNKQDEIARPFSRLTMKNTAKPTTGEMEKHWRYNHSTTNTTRPSFLKSKSSTNTVDSAADHFA